MQQPHLDDQWILRRLVGANDHHHDGFPRQIAAGSLPSQPHPANTVLAQDLIVLVVKSLFENQLTFSANGTTLSSIVLYRTWQQQTFYLAREPRP